jgi:hypothetical protein
VKAPYWNEIASSPTCPEPGRNDFINEQSGQASSLRTTDIYRNNL